VAGTRVSSKVIPGFKGSPFQQSDVRVQRLLHVQGEERCGGQSEPRGRMFYYINSIIILYSCIVFALF